MTTATEPVAADPKPFYLLPEHQRRNRMIARSKANRDVLRIIARGRRLQAAVLAFLDEHPERCRCRGCRGHGRTDAGYIREDLTGMAWLLTLTIAPLDSQVIDTRGRKRRAKAAEAADTPTVVTTPAA